MLSILSFQYAINIKLVGCFYTKSLKPNVYSTNSISQFELTTFQVFSNNMRLTVTLLDSMWLYFGATFILFYSEPVWVYRFFPPLFMHIFTTDISWLWNTWRCILPVSFPPHLFSFLWQKLIRLVYNEITIILIKGTCFAYLSHAEVQIQQIQNGSGTLIVKVDLIQLLQKQAT